MRRVMWSLALAAVGFGSLAMVGGTAIGSQAGALAVGYGVLVVLAGLYLAIRERVGRHSPASRASDAGLPVERLAGHRVF